jgi:lysozyme
MLEDPSLTFLNRLMDRIQRDPVYSQALADCVSHGAAEQVFALIDDPDGCDVDADGAVALEGFTDLELDDDGLHELAGGRGAMPLALALLAGTLGSGHALPGLDPASLGGLDPFAAGGDRRVRGLQSGWDDHALPLIREFEGLALEAYLDPVGIATIGYGTIRYPNGQPVQLGERISSERAEQLLSDAVAEHYAPAMLAAIPPARYYNAAQQAALISFTYNVGVGALQRSSLRRRLLAGEDPQLVIAAELPRWSRGDGRELPGLVRRRAAEVALFQRGHR